MSVSAEHEISSISISLGATPSETATRLAVENLIDSGCKHLMNWKLKWDLALQMVVVVAWYDRVAELIKAAKEVLGETYNEYTWFYGAQSMHEVLAYMPDDPVVLSGLEHWIGLVATFSEGKAKTLETSLMEYTADTLLRDLDTGLQKGSYFIGDALLILGVLGSTSASCDSNQPFGIEAFTSSDNSGLSNESHYSVWSQDYGDLLQESLVAANASWLATFLLHSYDMMWALAAGIAQAMISNGSADPPTGLDVMKLITEEGLPGFNSTTGWHEWDKNGDPKIGGLTVEFSSYSKRPGAKTALIETVASWSNATGFVFSQQHPIIWADGSVYPEVPDDGYVEAVLKWRIVVIPCVLVVALLGGVMIWLARKNCLLQSHVDGLTG
eukprot:scaffold38873_cov18-Prasinocladus_malaysianus.AAC.1